MLLLILTKKLLEEHCNISTKTGHQTASKYRSMECVVHNNQMRDSRRI